MEERTGGEDGIREKARWQETGNGRSASHGHFVTLGVRNKVKGVVYKV